MDENKKQKLRESGIEIDGMLERFMDNEAMIQRFMLKFLDDQNMIKLQEALESGDTDTAFRAAHTLKGLCRNLSLQSLDKVSSEITELLRVGDMAAAADMMPKVQQEYATTVEVIKENFGK